MIRGTEEQYVKQAYTELNPLTGLYYNRSFFKKADEFLESIDYKDYMLVAIDVEHFRLFNKIYGRETGDKLLIYIADCIKEVQVRYDGIGGYLGGDNFCIFVPENKEIIVELEEQILKGLEEYNSTGSYYPVFGVFSIENSDNTAIEMYDCATMALSKGAGKFNKRIFRYEAEIEKKIEEELELLADISEAIKKEEFTFFAQPQCDISTGKIVGAESLVRWKHGDKLISPGIFIPVLEKNGLIATLDRYVWDKVCAWLRSWLDRGYHPVPVSINVSRIDIFSMDVPKYLKELMRKYNLPERLLKIEITESAYAENNDDIVSVVKQLRKSGFMVMMDDFGSGYSSLSMLKNIQVDVIKLDMRFLDMNEQVQEKGIGILETVVNIARVMSLPIIVEGVETENQESTLRKMGCRYIQGYYYYKPLPIEQFEELLADEKRLDFSGFYCTQVENMNTREFLDNNLFSDQMINNVLGAIAFYEMYDNKIEITRVNDQYYKLTEMSRKADGGVRLGNHVRDDEKLLLLNIFDNAYKNQQEGAEGNIHYLCADGSIKWIHIKAFFLREQEGKKLFYGSLTDMTSVHDRRKSGVHTCKNVNEFTSEEKQNIEKYFGELPYGYCIVKPLVNAEGKKEDFEITYMNYAMGKLCGNSTEKLSDMMKKTFANQNDRMIEAAYQAAYHGRKTDEYAYSRVTNRYLQLTIYQFEYGYAGCILRDVTHTHIYDGALKSIMNSYREVHYVNLQDNYTRMIYPNEDDMSERGDYEEMLNRHFECGKILRDDEGNIRKFLSIKNIKNELLYKDTIEYRYKRRVEGMEDEWCMTSFIISEREEGIPKTAVMVVRSIEAFLNEEEERRQQNMAASLAKMADGFFVYRATGDEKILYANPRVLEIFGCDTLNEFKELVGNSFRGMVHKDDIERVESEIKEQIDASEEQMDYVQYRIIRKDGEIRWISDWGHMEDTRKGIDKELFYVFITDITDTMTSAQKEKLLKRNKYYS